MGVRAGVWKPTAAEPAKILAGAQEITNLSLKSGGGAAVVSFYNALSSAEAIPANLVWVLDASTSDADNESFDGLIFTRGVYAICEQGIGFDPIVCIARRAYDA